VSDRNELESLYQDAKAALTAKDYDRASDLLRQILKADVDYKDAAQLLARVIQISRRRWYNDPRTWGALGALLLVGLGIYLFPKLQVLYRQPAPAPILLPTNTPAQIIAPPATATATLLPAPTSIPLTWKRISLGQEFERDTVTAFATDKNDPDVIYAAMKNAGVYKTIDGGLSWRPAHQGLASTQVESLLIDSQNPQILYAGTLGGVFKTEDGTENWSRIGDGIYLLMDSQHNSHLYARNENGIYETKDHGNTWTTVYSLKNTCPDVISSWAIHPSDGNMLFIGGREACAGLFQSTDGGLTWKLIRDTEEWDNPNVLAIALDKEGDFTIHTGCDVLTIDPDDPSEIYCGASRIFFTQTKGDTTVGDLGQYIPGTQSKKYSAVHIDHPNGTERLITGATDVSGANDSNVGIFISEDSGDSWVERNSGIGSAWAEIRIDPMNNAKMFLGAYYEVLYGYTTDTGCTLYRSMDSGKNWLPIKAATWCGLAFDAANVLFMNEEGKLQKSENGGETWWWNRSDLSSSNPKTNTSTDGSLVFALPSYYLEGSQSVSANPYFEGLIYDVGDVIYYSTDAGVSWQQSAGSEGSWDARLFYTDQSKMIYAIGRYHQAYSSDNGMTWQACGQDVTASRSDTRMALDLGGSRLYMATPGQGVLVSTDNCGSWQPSNNGLTNLFVNTLALDPNDSNTIYAGTDGGAYISYDAGATWGQVNDGLLGATVVYSIAVDKESNVYAATPYGVFKLEGK
jgi:photosystem II stability/assembly factor-like uncharacterized protein